MEVGAVFDSGRVGVLDVAKKKTPPPPASGPESWNRKPLIANFRGSAEFKEWLQSLASADRQSVAGVIERALVHYAKAIGYNKEAPER
jgi:hypothetical protein